MTLFVNISRMGEHVTVKEPQGYKFGTFILNLHHIKLYCKIPGRFLFIKQVGSGSGAVQLGA